MGVRTEKQRLGDLGETFVADQLRLARFDVQLIGGNFPGYDILASRSDVGSEIRVQVKTWSESRNEKPLAKTYRLHMSDVFVLVRADDERQLRPYVYTVSEISVAKRNSETEQGFPFSRDPGTKNPSKAGFWARADWLFCDPQRLGAWHLVRPCPIEPILPPPERRQKSGLVPPNSSRLGVVSPAVAAREVRNGVRTPKLGGLCERAWLACSELMQKLGRLPTRREAVEYGSSLGLNPGNVGTEFSYWKKFNNFHG
jgi:hypothetical protein